MRKENERSSSRHHRERDDGEDGRLSKRSRTGEENGDRDDRDDRDRSDRREKDRRRSSRDGKDRDKGRDHRSRERGYRDRESERRSSSRSRRHDGGVDRELERARIWSLSLVIAPELVQLPLDLETSHCRGYGFVQFAQLEHAKAAQSLNGKLDIAGQIIKVSAVTDDVRPQDSGTNAADFDDEDGGGLSLDARSRAVLMQKLDRTGTAIRCTFCH
nr:PREDICTED: RNA-binding protein 5-B-like [Musa acuminata subsp. malaccensis]